MPSATGPEMRRVVEACEATGIRFRTLPGMGEFINGNVSVKTLRDVSYEDLLGRPPVSVDLPEIREYIKDRCVLVSGAGGSIGSELCRQIIQFEPDNVILLDGSEENLYKIQMELKYRQNFNRYVTTLGDVCNKKLG